MFVYLSKLLPNLVYPAGLMTILLLVGLVLCRSSRSKDRVLLLILLFILICGNKLPGAYLIRQLEQTYAPYDGTERADAIVILGGGTITRSDPRRIVEVNGAGDRVIYAVQLYRDGAAQKILTGGSYISWLSTEVRTEDSVSSPASEMAELLVMFGIPEEDILVQDRSLNTAEEAEEDAKILKSLGLDKIILVSSATHMRRAVPLFEKQGLEVIPAPTDYSFSDREWEDLLHVDWKNLYTYIIPTIGNMQSLQNALKEYLGYFVYQLRGWI